MSTTGENQKLLREQVARWNRLYPVGTPVHCQMYPGRIHRTCSPATLLFQRKVVVHLEGFSGYFDLNEMQPAAEPHTTVQPRTTVLFPGQGSQRKGMGRGLFESFPEHTSLASQILGYSIEQLCLEDAGSLLDQTRYTQAAIYVVNALGYLQFLRDHPAGKPAFLMGHSIGEYNALLAADVFDFETGLRLVMKRGELMGMVSGGAMAAVMGASPERIQKIFSSGGVNDIDMANYNTPTQIVISGPAPAIERAVGLLAAQHIHSVLLRVSGAFHSRYMHDARQAFTEYAKAFAFTAPSIPVVANATGRPYERDGILETLCAQIASPVLWMDSIRYVLGQGETELAEIGSTFLRSMVREISAPAVATG
jgi:trans-AT polyketide synthase/acyltransferase/oxidoreductase domain-containing protein